MIQSLPCPSCHRTLVLTAEASLQAVLRCRHCSHQFVLGEMIEGEMGFWEVVEDPKVSEAKVSNADEAVTEDSEIQLAESEEYMSPQMVINTQSEEKKTGGSKFEPIRNEQYDRMRRKAKSPMWSMLSVLLGGLASIPIATLLIWHVLGTDPLQMGPTVARYAPWIVPTRFQPRRYNDDILPPAPAVGASGLPRVSSTESTSSQSSPHTPQDLGTTGEFPTPTVDSADSITSEESTSEESTDQSPANDLFTLIGQVKKDLETWNERGKDKALQQRLNLQTYSDLASLALAINQLPSASPIRRLVRSELQSVGKEVAKHVDIQDLITRGARIWLANHKEDLAGLAFVISIGHIVEIDNAWQLIPTTAPGEESIQIIVPKEIYPSLSEGQSIFALGCVTRSRSTENKEPNDATSKSSSMLTVSYIYALKP